MGSVEAPPVAQSTTGTRRWWLGLGALLAGATVVAFLIPRSVGDDPNLAAAKVLLVRYEHSRPELERNYRNPIYGEALAHLDQVDPQSASGAEAQALAADVRRRIQEFARRTEQATQQAQAGLEDRARRDEEFFEAQRRAALTPVTSFPECEHENAGSGRPFHRPSR